MPVKELKAAVDQLVKEGELPRAKKARESGLKPKAEAKKLVARLNAKGEGRAKSVLQQMARLLGMEVVERKD